MFWKLNTGAGWRDLPERYGTWQTVYDRFRRWQRDGTLQRLLDRLQLRLDQLGRIDWDTWCVDGSNIRAARPAAGAKKGALKQLSAVPRVAGDRSSTC
jgi:transposase